MEYPEYRLVLENLQRTFGKGFVSVPEIARFDGCCARTVTKRYGIKQGCDISILAIKKCELARKK